MSRPSVKRIVIPKLSGRKHLSTWYHHAKNKKIAWDPQKEAYVTENRFRDIRNLFKMYRFTENKIIFKWRFSHNLKNSGGMCKKKIKKKNCV